MAFTRQFSAEGGDAIACGCAAEGVAAFAAGFAAVAVAAAAAAAVAAAVATGLSGWTTEEGIRPHFSFDSPT